MILIISFLKMINNAIQAVYIVFL